MYEITASSIAARFWLAVTAIVRTPPAAARRAARRALGALCGAALGGRRFALLPPLPTLAACAHDDDPVAPALEHLPERHRPHDEGGDDRGEHDHLEHEEHHEKG